MNHASYLSSTLNTDSTAIYRTAGGFRKQDIVSKGFSSNPVWNQSRRVGKFGIPLQLTESHGYQNLIYSSITLAQGLLPKFFAMFLYVISCTTYVMFVFYDLMGVLSASHHIIAGTITWKKET